MSTIPTPPSAPSAKRMRLSRDPVRTPAVHLRVALDVLAIHRLMPLQHTVTIYMGVLNVAESASIG